MDKSEEMRPLGSHALRWDDNIKIAFEEMGYVWKVCIVKAARKYTYVAYTRRTPRSTT